MEVFVNSWGDTIPVRNVERFDNLRGTIMGYPRFQKVCNLEICRFWIEDGEGGKSVSIWSSMKGYDKEKIKLGASVIITGMVQRNYYMGEDGTEKYCKEYKAHEIKFA